MGKQAQQRTLHVCLVDVDVGQLVEAGVAVELKSTVYIAGHGVQQLAACTQRMSKNKKTK